ncbi:hypothetical protein JCM11251_002842 [Rhodosporidiobolus azoricus]
MVALLSLPLVASILALSHAIVVDAAAAPATDGAVHTDHVFTGFDKLGRLGLALPAHGVSGHPSGPASAAASRRERRNVELEDRAYNPKVKRATGANYYSALVAIGASYTDNAHSRDGKYADSLRHYYPYDKYSGRYSNGEVAVEYMVKSDISPALKQQKSGVKLIDYAYGGSVVQNGLSGTSASWPAAKDQIVTYLSDLESGRISVGTGRVLHYFNSGINPVSQIWNNAIGQGMSATSISNAKAAITANSKAAAEAMRSINKNSKAVGSMHGVDYLLVGIPQMELVPTFGYQIPSSFSQTQRVQALALIKTLGDQWNAELRSFAASFKSETRANGSRVFYYDLAALWRSLHSSPRTSGITVAPTTTTCYNSSTGGVCGNPQNYLYFDTLHPVTSVHKLMAQKMNALVLGTA